MSIEEIKNSIEEKKDFLRKKYKINRIAIFGSRARKEEKETSDIDIISEFSKPMGWEIVELKEYLESLLGLNVDILTYKAVLRKPSLWNSIKDDLIYV
ncbi:MAG: nucleotidyltransferase family protein [Thermodesulfovibrionales bacterium]